MHKYIRTIITNFDHSRFVAWLIPAVTYMLLFPSNCLALTREEEKAVEEQIGKILSSSEFSSKKPGKSFIQMVGEMLRDFFNWIKGKVESLTNRNLSIPSKQLPSGLFNVLKIVGILFLLIFVVVLVYLLFRTMRSSRRVKLEEDAALLTSLKDPDRIEKMALECAEKSDYRQGVRFLYISLLLRMNEWNLIKIDKSKTNRQYLKEMLNNGYNNYKVMLEFTQAFNYYWYGGKQADSNIFKEWYGKYSLLKEEGEG